MALIKLNNKAVSNATVIGSISSLGSMTFIKKLTASSSATLSFVDGTDGVVLDDTYKEYYFTFNNMHPATDNVNFSFQADTGTNTSYNQTITSTYFEAYHYENDSQTALGYNTDKDLAQSTSFQMLGRRVGNDNDQQISGSLKIFNPSSSVFVKHFMAVMEEAHYGDLPFNNYIAGYFNTTTALTRFQFKMSSGNIDAGDICLYGIA
jgi:hypothetical protein